MTEYLFLARSNKRERQGDEQGQIEDDQCVRAARGLLHRYHDCQGSHDVSRESGM